MKKIISIMLVCMLITTISFAGTFTKSSNGSSISINVDQGKTILLKAREIFGKIFTGWTITGATVTDASLTEQTITMGSENITATANYATPYTITVNQTANGVISPSTVTVAEGSSKTFTITPNTGHEIGDVLVDGVSVLSSCVDGTGDEKTYTMSGINGNKTITATYSSTGGSENSSMIIPTINVTSKTYNSITVTTSAVDPNGGNLVYKLYADGILKATSNATASGEEVSLIVSDLIEVQPYSIDIIVYKDDSIIGNNGLCIKTLCAGISTTRFTPDCLGGNAVSAGSYRYCTTCQKTVSGSTCGTCGRSPTYVYRYNCSHGFYKGSSGGTINTVLHCSHNETEPHEVL